MRSDVLRRGDAAPHLIASDFGDDDLDFVTDFDDGMVADVGAAGKCEQKMTGTVERKKRGRTSLTHARFFPNVFCQMSLIRGCGVPLAGAPDQHQQPQSAKGEGGHCGRLWSSGRCRAHRGRSIKGHRTPRTQQEGEVHA